MSNLKYLIIPIMFLLVVFCRDYELNYQVVESYEFNDRLLESQWSLPSETQASRLLYGLSGHVSRGSFRIEGASYISIAGCNDQPRNNIQSTEVYRGSMLTQGIILESTRPKESDYGGSRFNLRYNIYTATGGFITKTDFDSPNVYLLDVYGQGKYVGFNPKTKKMYLIDPINGRHNEVDLADVFLKNGFSMRRFPDIVEGYILYNSYTQECLINFSLGNNTTYIAMISSNMELLWVKEGGFNMGVFSPSGNYLALKGYPTLGDNWKTQITIINRNGNIVSTIRDVGPSTWLQAVFYEDDNTLLTYNNKYYFLCDMLTGRVMRRVELGGTTLTDYNPENNLLVLSGGGRYGHDVSVFDISDTSKDRFFKKEVWHTKLSTNSEYSRGIHVSISGDGKEITVCGDHNLWILRLEE